MKLRLSLPALLLLAAPLAAQEAGTVTQNEIEPQAYAGVWYEIASVPAPFQAMCEGGTTTRYDLVDAGTLRVLNRCDMADGKTAAVEGTAESGVVFRLAEDGSTEEVPVTLGLTDGASIEITGGVDEGAELLQFVPGATANDAALEGGECVQNPDGSVFCP